MGRQVLAQLPATGVRVRALARNPNTAGLPPNVDVVRGDLALPGDPGGVPRRHRYGVPGVDRAAGHGCSRVGPDRRSTRGASYFFRLRSKPAPASSNSPTRSGHLAEQIERLIENLRSPMDVPAARNVCRECPVPGGRRNFAPERIPCAGPISPRQRRIDERDIAAVGVRALCEDARWSGICSDRT